MKRNKKILLTLGTLASVAAPVAAVVSCGTSVNNGDVTGKSTVKQNGLFGSGTYEYKVLPTYTGQADQLLSLGIKPDRYPFQLDKSAPFAYITNPAEYMIGQDDDFKTKFAAKLASLMPEDRGTSWWNQQGLDAGEKGSDPEYWEHRGGDFTMYEHYLLDDGVKKVSESTAVGHIPGDHTFVQTNFRESRDPFTRLPRVIMEALLDEGPYDKLAQAAKNTTTEDGKMAKQNLEAVDALLAVARKVEGTVDQITAADGTIVSKAADGGKLPSGTPKNDDDQGDDSWLYNDYFFAKSYHEQFLDNVVFKGSKTHAWIINDGTNRMVFDAGDAANDAKLARLFFAATYTPAEDKIRAAAEASYHVVNPTFTALSLADIDAQNEKMNPTKAPHHPIYEQQTDIGGAPMFEGAQRDNMLYFYNTASKLTDAFTQPADGATQADKDSWNALKDTFGIGSTNPDPRVAKFLDAQSNADKISGQLRTRMNNIAKLVTAAKAGGKLTFGLVTLAPGEGQTTLQTSSKYSFLYNELGFDQATPSNLDDLSSDPTVSVPANKASQTSFFNMDDNGWWWNLGEGTDVAKNANFFKGKLDMGLLTANDTQYKNLKGAEKDAIQDMFTAGYKLDKVDYNLWNEGLKTPFVMNMMLDKITDMLKNKIGDGINKTDLTAAKAWGNYWTTEFIK